MSNNIHFRVSGILVSLTLLTSLACLINNTQPTAIPVGLPPDFEVQVATPTIDPRLVTVEPTQIKEELVVVIPLGDAPTHTPDPNQPATPTQTRVVFPTDAPLTTTTTSTVTPTLTSDEALTETAGITEVVTLATTAPQPVSEPDPPLQGGDWDFEADFVPWPNPHGEPCPGASVASGWTAFVELGEYGSSCMNENLYQPNVFTGAKSQEITFDFITSNSGIYRTISTKVGHQYNIIAHAKHDRSLSAVQMALGVDLTGGSVWNAETVQWFPWDDGAEDTWVPTEETVTTTGETMTIFIKGFHPAAEQGGKTVIDNVSVTDLGR